MRVKRNTVITSFNLDWFKLIGPYLGGFLFWIVAHMTWDMPENIAKQLFGFGFTVNFILVIAFIPKWINVTVTKKYLEMYVNTPYQAYELEQRSEPDSKNVRKLYVSLALTMTVALGLLSHFYNGGFPWVNGREVIVGLLEATTFPATIDFWQGIVASFQAACVCVTLTFSFNFSRNISQYSYQAETRWVA